MRVRIGGEISASAYDGFRMARNPLERAVNARMERLPLGGAVDRWSLTAMILDSSVGFSPVRRFNRSTKVVVLHLPLELEVFVAASPMEKVRLLGRLLCESFNEAGKSGIPHFPTEVGSLVAAVRDAEQDAIAQL